MIRMSQIESVSSFGQNKNDNCAKQNISKASHSSSSSPFRGNIGFTKEMISAMLHSVLCLLIYVEQKQQCLISYRKGQSILIFGETLHIHILTTLKLYHKWRVEVFGVRQGALG